jgi:hypothetical protein
LLKYARLQLDFRAVPWCNGYGNVTQGRGIERKVSILLLGIESNENNDMSKISK